MRTLLLAVLLLAAPLSAQTPTRAQLDSLRADVVRVRAFNRSAETTMTRAIARLDSMIARMTGTPTPLPPPVDSTPTPPPPPPTGAQLVWSTDWPTTGTTDAAIMSGFQRRFCRFTDVLEITPGSPLGWTLTPNVARVTVPDTTTHCTGMEVTPAALEVGQSYYVRLYARVDSTGPAGSGSPTLHPVSVVHAGNIQAVYWSIRDVTAAAYRPVMQTDFAAAGFDGTCDLRWAPPALLPKRAWHRFEWHVEFVNVRAADADVRIWPRIYDQAGALLYDAETYRRAPGWCGSATETLAQFYARGGLLRFDDVSLSRAFGIGFEGKPTTLAGSSWSYAAPAVGVGGWIGGR